MRSNMQRLFRLPDGEERCHPEHFGCTPKIRCLRFRAMHALNVPLADHSTEEDDCKKFLELPDAEKAP